MNHATPRKAKRSLSLLSGGLGFLTTEMKTMKWKLVPEEPTSEMLNVNIETSESIGIEDAGNLYRAMISVSPNPEHVTMTTQQVQKFQNWKGMNGGIAFHLIERHADGWHQTQEMMYAWLDANRDA
jgi:hypothetical protein